MRRVLTRILVMSLSAILVTIAFLQFRHRYNFGHFVPYGLHVDVLSRDASIGIPGQKKMYTAELSNFSFWPVKLEACDFITDFMAPGTEYPHAVQRWDNNSGTWQTIGAVNADKFCRPYPLGISNTRVVSKRLWPGMVVEEATGWEATGARDPFQKGDHARFVVFRNLHDGWRTAVASSAFVIEDDVPKNSGPARVKH